MLLKADPTRGGNTRLLLTSCTVHLSSPSTESEQHPGSRMEKGLFFKYFYISRLQTCSTEVRLAGELTERWSCRDTHAPLGILFEFWEVWRGILVCICVRLKRSWGSLLFLFVLHLQNYNDGRLGTNGSGWLTQVLHHRNAVALNNTVPPSQQHWFISGQIT